MPRNTRVSSCCSNSATKKNKCTIRGTHLFTTPTNHQLNNQHQNEDSQTFVPWAQNPPAFIAADDPSAKTADRASNTGGRDGSRRFDVAGCASSRRLNVAGRAEARRTDRNV
jgi:hypothetical protein